MNDNSYLGFEIKSAGHNFLLNGMGYKGYAEDYTFIYVSKGHNYYINVGERLQASEGSFVFLSPGKHERIYEDAEIGENYYVIVRLLQPETFFQYVPIEVDRLYHIKSMAQDAEDLLEQIVKECVEKRANYHLCCNNLFVLLIVCLMRHIYSSFAKMSSRSFSSIKIAEYMLREQCHKNFTLDEYAKMCNMSKFHFSHKFKKDNQMSPIAFRKLWRLKKSKEFLVNTDLSIEKIAGMIGFDSATYYCSAFNDYYGMPPSVFRKQYKKII